MLKTDRYALKSGYLLYGNLRTYICFANLVSQHDDSTGPNSYSLYFANMVFQNDDSTGPNSYSLFFANLVSQNDDSTGSNSYSKSSKTLMVHNSDPFFVCLFTFYLVTDIKYNVKKQYARCSK